MKKRTYLTALPLAACKQQWESWLNFHPRSQRYELLVYTGKRQRGKTYLQSSVIRGAGLSRLRSRVVPFWGHNIYLDFDNTQGGVKITVRVKRRFMLWCLLAFFLFYAAGGLLMFAMGKLDTTGNLVGWLFTVGITAVLLLSDNHFANRALQQIEERVREELGGVPAP